MIAEATDQLLREAARALITEVPILRIDSGAILQGRSGATVGRYKLTPQEGRPFTLVTKEAKLRERKVLHLLNEQQQSVPRAYIPDLQTDAPSWMVMQDIPGEHRAHVLSAMDPEVLWHEANALAAVHARNLGHQDQLAYLPKVDWPFLNDMLDKWWRIPWQKALATPDFRRTFAQQIPRVESAADKMLIEVSMLNQESRTLSLVHNDLCPANVRITPEKQVYFLDWQEARLGSFYMDLPSLMPNFESTAQYRRALVREGIPVALSDFKERYRMACHYVGFVNLWSSLSMWRKDRSAEGFIRHWFSLILC